MVIGSRGHATAAGRCCRRGSDHVAHRLLRADQGCQWLCPARAWYVSKTLLFELPPNRFGDAGTGAAPCRPARAAPSFIFLCHGGVFVAALRPVGNGRPAFPAWAPPDLSCPREQFHVPGASAPAAGSGSRSSSRCLGIPYPADDGVDTLVEHPLPAPRPRDSLDKSSNGRTGGRSGTTPWSSRCPAR